MRTRVPMHLSTAVMAVFPLVACDVATETCPAPVFDTQGHRGARTYRPENTLPAFEYAISRGIRTVELDLAVTSDDVLVISHDPFLLGERCLDANGQPAADVPIRSLTLAEVTRFDCGTLRADGFPDQVAVPGTPPPTLREVMAMAERRTGGTIRYNMEIKMDPRWGGDVTPDEHRFVELLLAEVDAMGVTSRCIIQSFDPRPLAVLAHSNTVAHRALLWPSAFPSIHLAFPAESPVDMAQALGVDVLATFAPLTRAPLVALAHDRGLRVIAWTVNDRPEMERLINLGVDGLISDDVDLLLDVAGSSSPRGGVCF